MGAQEEAAVWVQTPAAARGGLWAVPPTRAAGAAKGISQLGLCPNGNPSFRVQGRAMGTHPLKTGPPNSAQAP